MTENENKIVGYLLKNTNSTFAQITNGTRMYIPDADVAMKSLLAAGVIKGRGYAAHTECYYVVNGREFMGNLGRAFIKSQS